MDKKKNTVLPPCRICGAASSGFHYGANTCEACKAFFRRSLVKHTSYECAERMSCEVSFKNRNACAYCRFQKCLSIGMCKDAIKTGRYSHEKRASNIRELKQLQSKVEPSSASPPTESFSSSSLAESCTSNDLQSSHSSDSLADDFQLLTYTSNNSTCEDFNTSLVNSPAFIQEPVIGSTKLSPVFQVGLESPVDLESPVEDDIRDDVFSPTVSRTLLYDLTRIEQYEMIIGKMVEMLVEYICDAQELGETLSPKESECLEMVELRKQIFGQLKPMSAEEYVQFYKETGIDIDDRRHALEACVLPNIENGVKRYISFAKTIPGFNELSLNDQITLIKLARIDFFMIGKHRSFNPKHRLFAPCANKVIHEEDMMRLIGDAAELFFTVQQKIRKLDLTRDETAVLCALCIMSADKCDVQDSALVEKCQDFLLECLFYTFDKNHRTESLRFARIIDCLVELRTVREDNYREEERLASVWWGLINFPPLLYEIWSSSTTST